jgi:hypothetical protein
MGIDARRVRDFNTLRFFSVQAQAAPLAGFSYLGAACRESRK